MQKQSVTNSNQSVRKAGTFFRSIPLILATLVFVLPAPSLSVRVAEVVALAAFATANSRWGEPRVWYAFALFLFVVLVSFIPCLRTWNAMVVPATIFALVSYFKSEWFAAQRWLVKGHPTRATWILFAITIPLSTGALLVWARIAQPDLSMLAETIPGSGIEMVIGAAIVFSVFNAIAEEVVFRGVLWRALSDFGFTAGVVMVAQAVAFGILHLNGVPSGPSGVVLAAIYGAALGGIRLLSKGLLMPIAAHIVADATIFMIVTRLAERW